MVNKKCNKHEGHWYKNTIWYEKIIWYFDIIWCAHYSADIVNNIASYSVTLKLVWHKCTLYKLMPIPFIISYIILSTGHFSDQCATMC